MIRDRLIAVLIVAVTLAGCGGDPAPAGQQSSPSVSAASLDMLGRRGCVSIAALVRDGNLGADVNQMISGAASASTNADVAVAGELLERASIAAAASEPGQDRGKLDRDIAAAQQAILTACRALLGDEPW